LKNSGEVVLAVFSIGECDFDSMGVNLSGRNFAKIIAKDSGNPRACHFACGGRRQMGLPWWL
jgi:hypothetical protein